MHEGETAILYASFGFERVDRVEEDINPAMRSPLPTTAAKQRVRRTSTWALTDSS